MASPVHTIDWKSKTFACAPVFPGARFFQRQGETIRVPSGLALEGSSLSYDAVVAGVHLVFLVTQMASSLV